MNWVPIKDGTPVKSDNYFITTKDEIVDLVYYDVTENKFYQKNNLDITLNVIAWMPTPKPYKPIY